MLRFRLLFLLAIWLLPVFAEAQSYQVRLHGVDMDDAAVSQRLNLPGTFKAQPEAYNFIQQLIPDLQQQGFLSASMDSLIVKGTVYDVSVFIGQQYRWAKVSFNQLPPALLIDAAIIPEQFINRPLNPVALSKLTEKILTWCDNNGFPFAKIGLDSVRMMPDGGVYGSLFFDKGKMQKIDSFNVEGDVHISRNYLMRYLGIRQGEKYSEKQLKNISARLRELPFLTENKPWSIRFKREETRLNLDLKEKKANQLSAILGFIPNSAASGKFLFTIDAQAAFQNILGYGETFSISILKMQPQSPQVKADLVYPYLLNTLIGAEGHFNLYFQDSTYHRVTMELGGRYQFTASDYLRVFYKNESNSVSNIDTSYVLANHKLPENADVSANGLGLEMVLNRTDYKFNPRSGWEIRLAGNALIRKVKPNEEVVQLNDGTGFDFESLYDSLQKNEGQYMLNGEISGYLPLAKKITLKGEYSGGWISNGPRLFQNELYQLGGFKLMRGFDELSIYATQYHIVTAELRLLISRNSNVYLFSDNGWIQTQFTSYEREGLYNGFGIGTTLETKSGIFSLAYALGRSDFNSLQVRQSKIHFGYVAYF